MIDHSDLSLPEIDLKSTIRKLFTDHAVYTSFVLKSIVDHHDADTKVLLPRLLQNQKDIGEQLKPFIGSSKGNKLTKVLTEHIQLAGAVIKDATYNNPQLEQDIKKLFNNSDDVAMVLTSINPELLPYEDTQMMFIIHNEFVIDQTLARLSKDYQQEQKLYDAYYNEILLMSDLIADAL
jgi:hypothetical protein